MNIQLGLKSAIFYLCYAASVKVLAFNINTDISVIFQDPSRDSGSYFGYSTSFHFNYEDRGSVLISAPKGNSKVPASGVLYKCDYRTEQCKEIAVQQGGLNETRVDSETSKKYKTDGSANMWLGVSLDTQMKEPFETVVCGHRWMSPQSDYNNIGRIAVYPMVGVCYTIPSAIIMAKGNSKKERVVEKLLPLYRYPLVVPYLGRDVVGTGVGMAGISAKFNQDTQDLYIGTPGVYHWIGGVVLYEKQYEPDPRRKNPLLYIPNERSFDLYAGYATATGNFWTNQGTTSVVLGAPKSADGFGKVYISALSRGTVRTVRYLYSGNELKGDQLGAYFGATLLAMKLSDADEFDILLVGSPLFSSEQGGDEGQVDVYVSDGISLRKTITLTGQNIVDARFGSALACIGDVNLDGFNDIAVGAPYESDHGAVYIYHGLKEGVRENYIQRIGGRYYGKLAKGFGISIARGMDIDGNEYPDLLIGSHESDSAFLLRSHPILQWRGTINASIAQIDIDMGKNRCDINGQSVFCFNITNCIQTVGKHLPEHMKVAITMQVDGRNGLDRGVFSINNAIKNKTEELIVKRDTNKCVDSQVFVIESDIQDYTSPVFLEMSVTLKDPVQKGRKDFCPECPVIDPSSSSLFTREIPFATGCGEDNICRSDLSLKFRQFGYDETIVLGQNRTIDVTVEVKNKGDPAFMTTMSFGIPKNTRLSKLPRGCINSEGNGINDEEQQFLECKLGNPLKKNVTRDPVIVVPLDISSVPNTELIMNIQASVKTTSFEISPQDCNATLQVYLETLASVDIIGYATAGSTTFRGSEGFLPVNHAYDVKKVGPTPVNRLKVTILLPYKDRESGTKFAIIDSVAIRENNRIRGYCDYSRDAMINASLTGDDQSKESGNETITGLSFDKGTQDVSSDFDPRTIEYIPSNTSLTGGETQALAKGFDMNCVKMECLTVTCLLAPFVRDGEGATIVVKAQLNMTALNSTYGLTRNMTYTSRGSVEILDNVKDDAEIFNTKQRDQVTMVFLLKVPPPPKPLPNWIIAVSAGAGFLLLGLIALGLLQLGFFKRKQHEEMKKLLQKATVVKEEDHCEDRQETNEEAGQYNQTDPDVFKI